MEKYLRYKAEDFLNDEVFIQWVKSNGVLNASLFQKLSVTSPELAMELEQAKAILTTINRPMAGLSNLRKDALFNRISSNIDENEFKPVQTTKWLYPLVAAACMVLLLFAKNALISDTKTISTSIAQQFDYILPDLSKVTLDPDSKIRFGKGFKLERTLFLDGMAFFEVQKGSKFSVVTPSGTIEVLGTSFSVVSRGEIFEVKCKTGKVKVTSQKSKESLILTPNEATILHNSQLSLVKATNSEFEWVDGNYYFENKNFGYVLDEFSRQFGKSIETSQEIRDMSYSGFFNKKDFESSLKAITWPMKLTSTIKEGKIIISNK